MKSIRYFILTLIISFTGLTFGQESIPRIWMNGLLNAIRNDLARPPVHARNLYHLSMGMYDAWAIYKPGANTFFLGKNTNGFPCSIAGVVVPQDSLARLEAQETAISYFAYRLIRHRFFNSPGAFSTYENINSIMQNLGYDPSFESTDYVEDGPAALGNYLAQQLIEYGLQDGSNEQGNYSNQYYAPVNPPIEPELPGNPNIIDPNRWQSISLTNAIDQAGNPISGVPSFVGAEWGNVEPFAMASDQMIELSRDGDLYKVYNIPDSPPYLDTTIQTGIEDFFKWNFLTVSIWQSHLDPNDTTMWDISPASKGNIQTYPQNWPDYANFYNLLEGGDNGQGYSLNPVTGLPYEQQLVKRGDYARVLAEFWADGLDSETPPGHWYEIYNEVSEHPLFERKWKGLGQELTHLEYDLKAYVSLGGAMHDAAISAWSVKGWFDYPRPVSAIRFLASLGQSSDSQSDNYHPGGIPLIPGYVEIVNLGDSLSGINNEHVGKIKLYTWKGHENIFDPQTDVSGVGWILAENWWPYQRPTFVSPPFAGYVSGHSTYSRAAAEVLTYITGSEYFPGGMSDFVANQNDFLHFEMGPSETIVLQWAKYKDASDQCSLSRIWGGIHPPIDDIPGRQIGAIVGLDAALFSDSIISIDLPTVEVLSNLSLINDENIGNEINLNILFSQVMDTNQFPSLTFINLDDQALISTSGSWINSSSFQANFLVLGDDIYRDSLILKIEGCQNIVGHEVLTKLVVLNITFDTRNPIVISTFSDDYAIIPSDLGQVLTLDWFFSEPMNSSEPIIISTTLPVATENLLQSLNGYWIGPSHYQIQANLQMVESYIGNITFQISDVFDLNGNQLMTEGNSISVGCDFSFPTVNFSEQSSYFMNLMNTGPSQFNVQIEFNKEMDQTFSPFINVASLSASSVPLFQNASSYWVNPTTYIANYNLISDPSFEGDVQLILESAMDNSGIPLLNPDVIVEILHVDTKRPQITSVIPSDDVVVTDALSETAFHIDIVYSEAMHSGQKPQLECFSEGSVSNHISYNIFQSSWINDSLFRARFNYLDTNSNLEPIDLVISMAKDFYLNSQVVEQFDSVILFQNLGVNLSLMENQQQFGLDISPNPVSVNSILNINSEFSIEHIKLIGTDGKIIFHEDVSAFSTIGFKYQLNIPVIDTGVYFLLVSGQNITTTSKVLVSN